MTDPTETTAPAAPEETTTEVLAESAAKTDGMTNRDALRQAMQEKREPRTVAEKPVADAAQPSKQEVRDAVAADPEPPQEFSAEGKAAWKAKDVTGIQKEFRRLSDSRTAEITRAQNAERRAREEAQKAQNEGKVWRDLGSKAAPYIAARGKEGVTPEQAMMEALSLIDALREADPAAAKAELKRLGIDLDKAPSEKNAAAPQDSALVAEVQALKSYVEQQQFREVSQTFSQSLTELRALKTRTGDPVYPGFSDFSDSGQRFAQELGSLTREPVFRNLVLRRFPNATHTDLVREAYIQLGGKVAGDPVRVSQSNQQHEEKSRRAAASTPGKPAARNDSSNLAGKLSNRAALARALAESREH
jgi:hypothetical protein